MENNHIKTSNMSSSLKNKVVDNSHKNCQSAYQSNNDSEAFNKERRKWYRDLSSNCQKTENKLDSYFLRNQSEQPQHERKKLSVGANSSKNSHYDKQNYFLKSSSNHFERGPINIKGMARDKNYSKLEKKFDNCSIQQKNAYCKQNLEHRSSEQISSIQLHSTRHVDENPIAYKKSSLYECEKSNFLSSYNLQENFIRHPCSETQNIFDQDDKFFFVSVMNFPLYTTHNDILILFESYYPLRITFICNEPRSDKKMTEAIVYFMAEEDATNAIINLDNTVYKGRVLFVADANLYNEYEEFSKLTISK